MNFWASYKLQNKLKGLGAGFGANYVDESYLTTANTFYIPSYTIYGAIVFYKQPTWRVGLKIDNLTNERYWSTWGAPQAPTTVLGSLTFKF